MFAVAMIGIILTMLLALVRAALGPTVFDRIVALNMMGTKTVLLIAVSGFLTGRPEWLDLALVYTLVNFVGTLAVLRFVRFGNLATDDRRAPVATWPPRPSGSGKEMG
jgi:multicomponent Na+:H+ antiporter subunit F